MIPQNKIDQIKNAVDFEEIISRYTNLKKSGASKKALCPFPGHNEKTPSFHYNPKKGICKCFGCGRGGDVFQFLKEVEGKEFLEVAQDLSRETGIDISTTQAGIGTRNIFKALTEAENAFHETLMETDNGDAAFNYLAERGFNLESIDKWKLGFCSGTERLESSIDDLIETGIIRQSESGSYFHFKNRIIFPFRNIRGQVTGFTGRKLPGDPRKSGKYINSIDSSAFNKSIELFGIFEARQAIIDANFVYIVEGQPAVVLMHQYGMENTVCASGTALTEKHTKILKRYTDNAVYLADGDVAGRKSVFNAIQVLLQSGINPEIYGCPRGQDPGDMTFQNGGSFKDIVAGAKMGWIDVFKNILKTQRTPPEFRGYAEKGLANIIATAKDKALVSMLIGDLEKDLMLPEGYYRSKTPKSFSVNLDDMVHTNKSIEETMLAAVVQEYISIQDLEKTLDIEGLKFSNQEAEEIRLLLNKGEEGSGEMWEVLCTLPLTDKKWRSAIHTYRENTAKKMLHFIQSGEIEIPKEDYIHTISTLKTIISQTRI